LKLSKRNEYEKKSTHSHNRHPKDPELKSNKDGILSFGVAQPEIKR
jgi:hypothetical protein